MCGYGPTEPGGKQTSTSAAVVGSSSLSTSSSSSSYNTSRNLSQEVNYAVCHENVREDRGSCSFSNSQQDEGAPNPEDLEVQRVLEGVSTMY